jgi:hypothetical protein
MFRSTRVAESICSVSLSPKTYSPVRRSDCQQVDLTETKQNREKINVSKFIYRKPRVLYD